MEKDRHEMEFLKPITDWLLALVAGIGGYVMYQHRRIDKRIDKLEEEYHRLDRSQAEIAVEIKEIKKDLGYIRKGMDKVIEKL